MSLAGIFLLTSILRLGCNFGKPFITITVTPNYVNGNARYTVREEYWAMDYSACVEKKKPQRKPRSRP